MLIINRPQTDPFFNIAAEEFLLKNFDADCFMLWVNQPSVIVGKHQNTLAEIDFFYALKQNIPVIRRISGGGTVFHDPGNLNFSFISKGEPGKLVDFRRFTDPIIYFLNELGVPARFEGKNDLRVNGLKISGNAEHVYKNKTLHHGTLLFSSQLDNLKNVLTSRPESFTDRAVQSVRSRVANIREFLQEKMDINEFKMRLTAYILKKSAGSVIRDLNHEEIRGINELVKNKYKTWKWNYGYSPDYFFSNTLQIQNVLHKLVLRVQKGKITSIRVGFENKSVDLNVLLNDALFGKNHNYYELRETLAELDPELTKWKLNSEKLIKTLF
jgi:lipoate-protein ligase A